MIAKTVALGFLAAAAVFSSLFYNQYFKWRACFNTQGRCLDSETGVVYHAQSGPVWLGLAILATGLAIWQLRRLMR